VCRNFDLTRANPRGTAGRTESGLVPTLCVGTCLRTLRVLVGRVAAGSWGEDNPLLQAFAVTAVPSFWLIAPDGTVLARDVPLGELEGTIERALEGSK